MFFILLLHKFKYNIFKNYYLTNPVLHAILYLYRGVEQMEARRAHNPKVASSSLASATKYLYLKSLLNQAFFFYRVIIKKTQNSVFLFYNIYIFYLSISFYKHSISYSFTFIFIQIIWSTICIDYRC